MTASPKTAPSQGEVDYPTDPVLDTLDAAVAEINSVNPDAIIAQVESDVPGYLDSLLQTSAPPTVDPCGNSALPSTQVTAIAPMCLQRSIDLNTSANTYSQSTSSAKSAFVAARDAWQGARTNYNFAMNNAQLTATSAVAAAKSAYNENANPDSASRNQKLYYTMQQSAATALQTYETSAQSAGETLATAAGALLSAYVAYVTALDIAQTAKMIDDATAQQTFWAAVEGVFDN